MLLTVEPSYASSTNRAWIELVVATVLSVHREACSPQEPGNTVSDPGEGDETLDGEACVEISVTVTNDTVMRDLNQRYRGIDQPTNVLAFPQYDINDQEWFVTPSDGAFQLGDVVISYPQVQLDAFQYEQPERKELAYLLLHGVLHLLGYDHEQEEDFALMMQQEERILGQLGLQKTC